MSQSCDHKCGSCSSNCAERKDPKSFLEAPHELSKIKHVIGVVSGKGGVGKSMVTSLLAVLMQRKGFRTAIMDADITGPSIPKAFGLKQKAMATDVGMMPVETKTGIKIMSLNLLLEHDTDPVVWRGPILAGSCRQFWTEVVWGDIDFMFIDMPPGTGDVPLTIFQSVPIDGVIVVATPQELVSMIVEKAVNMARLMNIPVLGLVENMAYFECSKCHEKHEIFGVSHLPEEAERNGITNVAQLPMEPGLALSTDKGLIELFVGDWLDGMSETLENVGQDSSKS